MNASEDLMNCTLQSNLTYIFIKNESTFSIEVADGEVSTVLGPEYHRQMRLITLFVMIVTSLIGNVLMCVQIMREKGSKHISRVQLLFINLAVADLSVTLFAMTSQLVWEFMGREWIAGAAFCPIFKVLQTFTMVSSNYLIVTVALDRHLAIVYPLDRNPRTLCLLVAAWMTSLLPSLPNAYIFHEYTTSSGKVFCVAKFYTSFLSLLHRQLYMAFIFLSVFIIPMFIIVGLYARILYVIWTRSKVFRNIGKSESQTSSLDGCTRTYKPKTKVKTLKMTLTVVVTFLATCLPYLIQEMIIAFGDPTILNENILAMTGIISASNSMLNPYIYLLFSSKSSWATRFSNIIWSCSALVPTKDITHRKHSLVGEYHTKFND